jgi:hypothetical protein
MHHLAIDQPRDGLQTHVRMRADREASRTRNRERAEVIDEAPSTDRSPSSSGQRPRYRQSADLDCPTPNDLDVARTHLTHR